MSQTIGPGKGLEQGGLRGPEGFTYEEALLPPDLQEELNALRRKQFNKGLGDPERQRLLELQELEDSARHGGDITPAEQERYIGLTRKREQEGLNPQEVGELRSLQEKMDRRAASDRRDRGDRRDWRER